ncbi:MAG: hypothetical protein ACR2NR_00165 [Solirubrobacteraceae bacterium]
MTPPKSWPGGTTLSAPDALAGHHDVLRSTAPANARVDRTPADYWNAAGVPRPF